jgi:hypothetical protein
MEIVGGGWHFSGAKNGESGNFSLLAGNFPVLRELAAPARRGMVSAGETAAQRGRAAYSRAFAQG